MHLIPVVWLGFAILSPPVLFAQDASPGSVSGEGVVTLERPPSRMRMTIELRETGPSTKEALSKLSERKEAATLQLGTLNVEKKSIQFGKPGLVEENNSQRQQMEALIQQRVARGLSVPKGLQMSKSVKVSCQLTAEWPITAKTAEQLLIQAKELQERIKKADLAGLKEPKKLSPEEAELAEELEAMGSDRYYDDSEAKPGEPQFVYLAEISDDELNEAMKKAFAQAKRKAERLAVAAGANLGNLASLKQLDSVSDYDDYRYYDPAARRLMPSDNLKDTESKSATPTKVTFQFRIAATFHLSGN